MSNNLKNKNLQLSISFFRRGKSYYYNFNGEMYEINAITINKLKEKLNEPFKVQFYAMSRAQIEKVVADLLDNTMDVTIKKINSEKDNILRFEATFTQQKRYVEVYKVPNVSSLYSRTTNCNPFLYTDINSKKVLIEVSKEYAKNNADDYYFLFCDLDMAEREFFDSQYAILECDYVYKLEKDLSDKKIKQKRMRKKF